MKKNICKVTIIAILIFGFSALNIFLPKETYSDTERRALEPFPVFTADNVINGTFRTDFEKYATDAVPFRDAFRSLKAYFSAGILGRLENNGLFKKDGHVSKLDGGIDADMLDMSAQKFKAIVNTHVKDTGRVYFSIVPDKNYVIADGYPVMDYELLAEKMKEITPFMKYIDIYPLLDKDDYYTTDTHWKQEKITDIALCLAKEMGADVSAKYKVKTLENDFYGVYTGQYAMALRPDTIRYLTNDTLENAKVSYVDNSGMAKEGDMYNMEKAFGKDPYEMFLSGAMPVVFIENPNAKTDRELIMFRDSYGSSIAPLMLEGYSKITLIDIRYINSAMVGSYADFDNADVLFLYSSSLLNSSTALR